ncbi:MAG TPA: PAS domain S-box protein [Candidatus Paceibacterota bacterium]|nr:PAS domain S-box protein [Verrucomicrobiota bacterium]HRY51910.1 PAS domain S-box protein [Candidatus Paceibacterota bacterium]HSA03055.1 PAS domain S-box protein [Candidatus Paceibacterota bacterium]
MNKATRVLIVDDDPGILRLISYLLREEGYEVWEASNGQDGLRMTREKCPDLVLLDVMMPDISGIDVCKQIKADPALPDVFVVLVSGEATTPGHKILGLETGADDYMSKPMDMREFLARIRTIVRLRDTTAALRASEQHYRRLVEILPDAVTLMDPDGRLITVNPQAIGMLGYANENELVGKNLLDLTDPKDHQRSKADLASALASGIVRNTEYTVLRKNGESFPIEMSAAAVTDAKGKLAGLVSVGRDITERKQAEKALHQHEAMLQKIVDTAMDGFWIVDLEGRFIDVNEAYCRMIGYSREELRSKRISDVEATDLSPTDAAHQMHRVVQTGMHRYETRHRRKDGRIINVEVSATYLELGDRYSFAFLRDITLRNKAAEELRRLPWRIIEAQEAERLRVARELHDGVNQIIASAKMRLHEVTQTRLAALNPSTREIIARCERQLVQALEENRRIARNLRPSDLDELGLAEACRNLCKELQARTKLKVDCRISRLKKRFPPDAELSLFRIIQEAITNAEKYARATTVKLRIITQEKDAVVKIQDDGHGFAAAHPKADKRKGHGFGFTNMRERAASLGGTCEITSNPKKGTTVTVRIPLGPAAP